VAAGLVIAHRAPEIFNYDTRLRTRAVWDTVIFLLNGFIFILIGMQLPAILKSLAGYTVLQLISYGIAISSVTILVRIIWVFAGASAQKLLTKWSSGIEENTGPDLWKNVLIVAWTGTRGVVSLATALALPLVLHNGKPLIERPLIIFLAFMVIFATFIIQGMSLPLLIKLLKIRKGSNVNREEKELQLVMTERIIAFITNDLPLVISDKVREDIITQYKSFAKKLEYDIAHPATSNLSSVDLLREPVNQLLSAQIEIATFRRQLLLQFHKEDVFSDDVIRKYERDMDMEEMNRNR
jgi:CPA1 family monovalent cation:H+ antiporter